MKIERQIGPADSEACVGCAWRLLRGVGQQSDLAALSLALNGLGSIARTLYDERRRRDQFFNASLFAEPAWDMLLDLRIQSTSARPPSVSSTCIGAAAPASTAHRHLLALEEEGLVERATDPSDARRKFTKLSAEGVQRVDAYLADVVLGRLGKAIR